MARQCPIFKCEAIISDGKNRDETWVMPTCYKHEFLWIGKPQKAKEAAAKQIYDTECYCTACLKKRGEYKTAKQKAASTHSD